MSSSSSSSSSSSKEKWPFDVFINFRGEDVRSGFVADLHKCLLHGGINAYIDSEDLRRGDEISPALMKAIEESRIAVLVFSENYASSSWCLDELVKVMECRRLKGQRVLPVFYKVEPGVIRGQRKSYGTALAGHEEKLGEDSERMKKWRQALIEAGNLSGWHYGHGDENEFIEKIGKEISTIVARVPLSVAKYPVGVGCRVEKVMSLLSMGSDDVRMIGIWGTGGVGKTTISKDVYNSIASQFDGCSFLANVRETSSGLDGLVHLQEKLLSEILWKENLVVLNVDGGANLIRDRLCCKKILLVLDDVDHGEQLNALARECEWFGKGSRIIVTTRDTHLLSSHGIDQVYKVEPLDRGEATKLLSSFAFLGNPTKDISTDLIHNILDYANGLPLAIVVLGGLLCGRSREEWESKLEELAKSPLKDINKVLKISFDALDDNQKDIFLDIACFFKGRERDYVTRVLDGCGSHALFGIQTLIERSLVTIDNGGKVQMHDLIQLMGQDAVKQESPNYPGTRSRLWCYYDVYEVLSAATGTNDVKGIVLQLRRPAKLHISHGAFTHMRRLKLLILSNARISGGPVCLPDDLRWLEWHRCHSATLEFSAGPKKLVYFDVSGSEIKEFRGYLKDFTKLKFITFSECQSLVCMLDLNHTPNLEILDLSKCKNLERAHESVSYHKKLQFLNLGGCSKLHHLPDVLHSKKLQLLNLNGCSKLQRLPDFSDKMKCLQGLNLRGTSIEGLPASIENLISLGEMDLFDCKKLAILPSSIYRLPKLEFLSLHGCSKLVKFPKREGDSSDPHMKMGFPKLRLLRLDECNLSDVEFLENPSCFPSLNYLFLEGNNFNNLPTCKQPHLPVSYCQKIQEFLDIPGQFQRQWALGCESLSEKPSYLCDSDHIDFSSSHGRLRLEFWYSGFLNYKMFHHLHGHQELFMPGGEMPEWLLPNNEGQISFMASKDLLEKFLGLAFCVVARAKCGQKDGSVLIRPAINGQPTWSAGRPFEHDFNHVWLKCYEPRLLWDQVSFGPNGWNCFIATIRAHNDVIVKKCGFRLICKPLENDLEIFLQHNQSLDRALLYEVRHEDDQMSTVEESSSEIEDLLDNKISREENSSSDLILEGSNVPDFPIQNYRCSFYRDFQNVVPRGEMPEEFVPVEDDTISFMVSQDLYDKFLGLALCVVFSVEDGKKEISFNIVPRVNDERRNVLSGTLGSFDSDHMWIQYLKPNVLWGLLEGEVDFDQFEESYLLFSLEIGVSGGTMKKLGYVLRCGQLEDDLKVVLEENQFVDPAALCEDLDGSRGLIEFFKKCHLPIEDLEFTESESESIESESESIESEEE